MRNYITFSHLTGQTKRSCRDYALIITVPQNCILIVGEMIGYYIKEKTWGMWEMQQERHEI